MALSTPRFINALFKEHISVVEIWLRITLLYIIAFNVYKIPSYWVFIAAGGLPLVAEHGAALYLWCMGFLLQWLLIAEHGL